MKSRVLFVCAALSLTAGCGAGDAIPEAIGVAASSGSSPPAVPSTYVSTSPNTIAASSSNTVTAPFQSGDETATYYVPSATTQISNNPGTPNGAMDQISTSNTVTIASDANDNISSVAFNISTGGISFTPTFTGSAISYSSPFIEGTNGNTPGPSDVQFFAQALSYSGWGVWDSEPSTGVQYSGVFTFGIATQPSSVPTTGTATYNGLTGGTGTNGPNSAFVFLGTAQVIADFSSHSVNTTFSALTESNLTTSAQTSIPDITGAATISGNEYTGSISGGGLSGKQSGFFYGPSAQETAGIWNATNGSTVLIGSYAAK